MVLEYHNFFLGPERHNFCHPFALMIVRNETGLTYAIRPPQERSLWPRTATLQHLCKGRSETSRVHLHREGNSAMQELRGAQGKVRQFAPRVQELREKEGDVCLHGSRASGKERNGDWAPHENGERENLHLQSPPQRSTVTPLGPTAAGAWGNGSRGTGQPSQRGRERGACLWWWLRTPSRPWTLRLTSRSFLSLAGDWSINGIKWESVALLPRSDLFGIDFSGLLSGVWRCVLSELAWSLRPFGVLVVALWCRGVWWLVCGTLVQISSWCAVVLWVCVVDRWGGGAAFVLDSFYKGFIPSSPLNFLFFYDQWLLSGSADGWWIVCGDFDHIDECKDVWLTWDGSQLKTSDMICLSS